MHWAVARPIGLRRSTHANGQMRQKSGHDALIEEVGGLTLVGTAHVSAQSVADVERVIRDKRPDAVLVELDPRRLEALRHPEAWANTDIFKVLRDKKQHLFLLQLYLASMQARVGRATGVAPGAELLRAIEVAEETGAKVVLMDRDVGITMRRGFGSLRFGEKLRLGWNILKELAVPAQSPGHLDAAAIDKMRESDAVTEMTEEFAEFAPAIKKALIDERDDYMSSHLREASGRTVGVVGAGHVPGIIARLKDGRALPSRAELEERPKRRVGPGLVLAWLVPLLLAVAVGYLIANGRWDELQTYAVTWIVLHAVLAGLGAAIAFGHPFAILTAACAAPFTSILPVGVRSGWLAGLVQAKAHTPKVRDFAAIKTAETFGAFWRNGVVRVLTVAAMTNLGSLVATWLTIGSAWWGGGGIV